MINSYNDSFMKNFNGEEQVKSYNETFINKPGADKAEGSYNRFFMNNTNTNEIGSQHPNPFIDNNSNGNYGDEYVKSFAKDFTPIESSNGSNSFDINNRNYDLGGFNKTQINSNIPMENTYNKSFIDNNKGIDIDNNDMATNTNNLDPYNNYISNNNEGFIKSKELDGYGINKEPFNNRRPEIRQENYNAPFGNDGDNTEGRYIRSFINSNNESNTPQTIESNDFIVRNQEIDKELSLNNQYFTDKNNTESTDKSTLENKDTNEHKDNLNLPNNQDTSNYNNINFAKDIKEDKVTYKDMFEAGESTPNTVEVENETKTEGFKENYNDFNIDPSLRINGIHEEIQGSYNKFFFNGNEESDNDIKEENIFQDQKEWASEISSGDVKEYFNEHEYYPNQKELNSQFFNNFFNGNKEIKPEDEGDYSQLNPSDISNNNNDYPEEVNEDLNSIRYKSYDKPSAYNLNMLEQRRLNQEFFGKYFNEEKEMEDVEVKKNDIDNNVQDKQDPEIENFDKLLRQYRGEEKVQDIKESIDTRNSSTQYIEDSYNKNTYNSNNNQYNNEYNSNDNRIMTMESRGNLDYFNNEYINDLNKNNEDRRSKVNYPQNFVERFNNNEDRRNKINYPQNPVESSNNRNIDNNYSTNNSGDFPIIMQFNNKLKSIGNKQYLTLNTMGSNILRGDSLVRRVQANNDSIKLPTPGVYRIDINIEYSFMVLEYLAGRDYEMSFTLEDGNRKSILIMNKVSPTSSKSTYIVDSLVKSELIDVREVPCELKLKLNSFSFSNEVPLDISNMSILITKVSN